MTELFELGGRTETDFDAAPIGRRWRISSAGALAKSAAFIRQRAISSIRRPRRMRLEELPPDRRQVFERRLMDSRNKGGPPPVLPYASSKPGEPPRTPTGILRETIVFAVEIANDCAVIGPTLLNGKGGNRIPSVLEFGGDVDVHGTTAHIEPRPFMRPALEAEASKLPQLFEGIL